MKKYGLIGKSLEHSFSKAFFDKKFKAEKIKASYSNFELETIESFLALIENNQLDGLNVTIPYKTEIIPYLSAISSEAKAIGAVNTILIREGKLFGANTDAIGFANSIKPFLNNQHHRALILGSGGASKAVEFVFKNIGIEVTVMSRKPNEIQLAYDDANQLMVNAFKVIVNCTPVGTSPDVDALPDFPIHLVGKDHLIIDLIYNPAKTKFLEIAEKNGAQILNGESMLHQQAQKSWELWNS
jgi:shikimate dehydrogenase